MIATRSLANFVDTYIRVGKEGAYYYSIYRVRVRVTRALHSIREHCTEHCLQFTTRDSLHLTN